MTYTRKNAMRKTPKMECEELMEGVLPVAEKTLADQGGFFPYGGAMLADGRIEMVAASDGDEHPPSERLIDMLVDAFRAAAEQSKYRATAIVYDVKVIPPGATEKTDAILVRLDHVSGYSVQILFPYRLGTGREILFGRTFATAGLASIFPRQ